MSTTLRNSTTHWQDVDVRHHLHPFTHYQNLAKERSRIIVRADGAYLWDSEGERILDGMAGLWCVNMGYGRRELADAAYRQMIEMPFYNSFFNTTNVQAVKLAAALAE